MQKLTRLKVEMGMLTKNPPPGVHCWQDDENSEIIQVDMIGPVGSPYEKGTFRIEVTLSDRYPFTPPSIQFLTQIYHPNIDQNGRVCLAALKPKPSGTWTVLMNIPTILGAIRVLLSEPNVGDALMSEIAKEYVDQHDSYRAKAEEGTMKYAVKKRRYSVESDTCQVNESEQKKQCEDQSFGNEGDSKSEMETGEEKPNQSLNSAVKAFLAEEDDDDREYIPEDIKLQIQRSQISQSQRLCAPPVEDDDEDEESDAHEEEEEEEEEEEDAHEEDEEEIELIESHDWTKVRNHVEDFLKGLPEDSKITKYYENYYKLYYQDIIHPIDRMLPTKLYCYHYRKFQNKKNTIEFQSIVKPLKCPFDPNHVFHSCAYGSHHLIKCAKYNHPEIYQFFDKCDFNSFHYVQKGRMNEHLENCQDYKVWAFGQVKRGLSLDLWAHVPKNITSVRVIPKEERQEEPNYTWEEV